MPKILSCTVQNNTQADRVLSQLQSAGFTNQEVSILFPEKEDYKRWVHEKDTKAPEGAATGASTGGVIGGILGWLAGIGSLAIPGIGPFIAAGPIMAALSGTAIGALVGGLTGTLVGLGIPEYVAKEYEKNLKAGEILIAVHTTDDEKEKRDSARKIFKDAEAKHISEDTEERIVENKSEDRVQPF